MAQNYYQKERGLTLKCTQQDRSQKPRSTWKVKLLLQTMIFQQGAQHRRCRSLTFASTITPDCERHEFRNTADIFFVPIRESMLNSFVSRKTFFVRSQKGKKCVSKDFLFTTIVDDINNKNRCRQCPSKSRALSEGQDYLQTLTKCQHSVYYFFEQQPQKGAYINRFLYRWVLA